METKHLTTRIPLSVDTDVNAYAESQGITKQDAVTALLTAGLNGNGDPAPVVDVVDKEAVYRAGFEAGKAFAAL